MDDDMATALMMVATAVYQDVESPTGHVALFDPTEGPNKPDSAPAEGEVDLIAPLRQARMDSIADSFRQLEQFEVRRGEGREKPYQAMRLLTEQFLKERR